MLKFRKFSFLYEELTKEQYEDYDDEFGFYGKKNLASGEKYWETERTVQKNGWTFTVPALGGQNAKGKPDITIQNNEYFDKPLNIELKINKSKLAYSTDAQKLHEDHIGSISPDRESTGGSRQHYQADIDIMKHYLQGQGIDVEGDSPTVVIKKYKEHVDEKKKKGETVHHPPVSTNILNAITKKWRDEGIDGVFMSHSDDVNMDHKKDDKRHKTSKHFDDDPEHTKPPEPYRKVYAQIHDLIDRTLEWKPKVEKLSTDENSEPHPHNRNHRIWSTEEDSDNTIAAGNMHIAVVRGKEYVRAVHKTDDGSEYHYFIRDNIPEEERHEHLLGEWGRNKNSTVYKKDGEEYIRGNFNDKGEFEPDQEKEIKDEVGVRRNHSNIKKRSDSIGLGSESFSHIKSGYDVNSPRHIYHQFLDEMHEKHGKKQ